jgi:hypothetical protein
MIRIDIYSGIKIKNNFTSKTPKKHTHPHKKKKKKKKKPLAFGLPIEC